MTTISKIVAHIKLAFTNPLELIKKIKNIYDKEGAHMESWRIHYKRYEQWYNGEIKQLYQVKNPNEDQKVILHNKKHSAAMTWFELHQKPKYKFDLDIDVDVFKNKKILDVGSGAFPSALVFEGCEVYCLDPLYHKYLELGFPLHYYENRVKFVHGYSEDMPLESNFFDAVISVNAIDHVRDLEKTSEEIKRVLKPNGAFAMHVHYHKPTPCEPIEINDQIFLKYFSWVKNLKKVSESQTKMGYKTSNNEKYCLWKNF